MRAPSKAWLLPELRLMGAVVRLLPQALLGISIPEEALYWTPVADASSIMSLLPRALAMLEACLL